MSWTYAEEQFLRDNSASCTIKQLTMALVAHTGIEKSPETVRFRCKKLGLPSPVDGRRAWTDDELEYLHDNRDEPLNELCSVLDRSEKSVKSQLYNKTFVYEMKQVTPWRQTMLEKIDELGKSIYDVACEMWQGGKVIEVKQNDGMMAVFCRERRE